MTAMNLNMVDLAACYGGTLLGEGLVDTDMTIQQVSIDSRQLAQANTFVALRGDKFDAHDYLNDVCRQGIRILVVEEPINVSASEQTEPFDGLIQWVVEDTTHALGHIAQFHRQQCQLTLAALTGSAGKTTVKGMLAAICEQAGPVHATHGNLNNHIGVPLTLMSLTNEHEYAVIEMGASGIGEIQYLAAMAQPDVVLVNNVGVAHLEGFGSYEGVRQAKGEIYPSLTPGEGVAVINIDDPASDYFYTLCKQHQVITFSVSQDTADIKLLSQTLSSVGTDVVLSVAGETIQTHLHTIGEQNVANALAAASMAHALGISATNIALGLQQFQPVSGRMQSQILNDDIRIIDDSYNANPVSVKAAISALKLFDNKKILVLGYMGELGEESDQMHTDIGEFAAAADVDLLIIVGEKAKKIQQGALDAGMAHSKAIFCIDIAAAVDEVSAHLQPSTTVLIKGSRSAQLDKLVAVLTSEEMPLC